jgi:hypothetical protein
LALACRLIEAIERDRSKCLVLGFLALKHVLLSVMEKIESNRNSGYNCPQLEALRLDLAQAWNELKAVSMEGPAAIWDGASAAVCASSSTLGTLQGGYSSVKYPC